MVVNKTSSLSDEEILTMLERGEMPVHYVQDKALEDTFTQENIQRFAAGELTWAQLVGMTMAEAYAIADRAYTLFEEGKQADARTMVESLVLANPNDAYLHGLLASFYQRSDMPEEALEEYGIALELDPSNIQCHVNRGELLLQAGRFHDAMTHLQRAVSLDSSGGNPSALRARALARATAAVLEQVIGSAR